MDGDWEREYDAADSIMEEVATKLKEKNKVLEDIATKEEIDSYYFAPRIRNANVFLIRAKALD